MFVFKRKDNFDEMPEYRYGTFDESGYVFPIKASISKKEFEGLNVPDGTKPFRFASDKGFVPVYLRCSEGKRLKDRYSRDGIWLCAEKLYSTYERNASFSGKVAEFFARVGDIKNALNNEFSLRANLFIVILILLGSISVVYAVAKASVFP